MKPLYYFRWFPAEVESDEFYTSLTDTQRGFFHRCLNLAWRNGASLPSSKISRMKLLRVSASYEARMWRCVGKGFVEHPNDPQRLVNPKQWEEWEHATSKSSKATAAAKSGAEQRSGRSANADIRAYDYNYDSSSSSLDTANPEQNTTRARDEKPPELEFELPSDQWPEGRMVWTEDREEQFLREIGWGASPTDAQVAKLMAADGKLLGGDQDEEPGRLCAIRQRIRNFDLFWRDYWRKVGKKKAREIWLKVAISDDDAAKIWSAQDRQTTEMLKKDEQYRPHAATWLGQERWNDEPAITEEQESLWMTA